MHLPSPQLSKRYEPSHESDQCLVLQVGVYLNPCGVVGMCPHGAVGRVTNVVQRNHMWLISCRSPALEPCNPAGPDHKCQVRFRYENNLTLSASGWLISAHRSAGRGVGEVAACPTPAGCHHLAALCVCCRASTLTSRSTSLCSTHSTHSRQPDPSARRQPETDRGHGA